jgi:chaperonin GroES
MYEKIRPLYDRVLIKKANLEEKTEGGIILPESSQEKAQTGQVVATGEGHRLSSGQIQPLQVKKGDMVFFGKFAGTEAGDDYLVIREDEILGVVEQ